MNQSLDTALGDLASAVEVDVILSDPATISSTGTPLWDALQRAVARPFPTARLTPELVVGFTDARICSFECTFCAECADALDDRCANCGGELMDRPTRTGKALASNPASTERKFRG